LESSNGSAELKTKFAENAPNVWDSDASDDSETLNVLNVWNLELRALHQGQSSCSTPLATTNVT